MREKRRRKRKEKEDREEKKRERDNRFLYEFYLNLLNSKIS